MPMCLETIHPIELIFSLLFKKIFASTFPNVFFKMLEKVANRRITFAQEEDKIIVDVQLFNELTTMDKFAWDSKDKKIKLIRNKLDS